MIEATFSDIDFFLGFDSSGSPIIRTDEEAINQSIRTILTTRLGERVMEPEFGSRLRDLLFQPMDIFTAVGIEEALWFAIERWEPRVILREVVATPDEDNNIYRVALTYTIKEISKNATFKFALASKATQ